MSRRRTVLATALSLLPLGQPLLLGYSTALATGAVLLSTQAADAQSADDYLKRGNAKSDLKDYQGAIADYSKAIEINPKDAAAYNNRGVANRKLGDNRAAIADYNKALEIDSQLAVAYLNRGISKENDGNLTGACADWREASALGDEIAAKWVKESCR